MGKKFFTVNEIAKMFDMNPKTIRRYIQRGTLQAHKIGGQWRITQQDLKKFLDTNEEFMEENLTKWHEDINEFVEGKNQRKGGKVQIVTLIDIFVDSLEEAKILSNSLMDVINNRKENTKMKFRYSYEPDIKKARFILSGDHKFISMILNALENDL